MATAFSRAFLLAILLGFVSLIGATSAGLGPFPTAHAQPVDEFSRFMPARLHVGDSSHVVDADADPALPGLTATDGLAGYCVGRLGISEVNPVGGADGLGFTVTNGAVESTDFFSDAPGSNDDIYCVVVRANSVVDPETGLGTLVVHWTYEVGGIQHTIDLEIELFEVRLEKKDGVLGGSAEVCTINWDPDILTGYVSNQDPSLPDPTDEVELGTNPTDPDWVIDDTGAAWEGGVAGTIEKLGQFRKAPDGLEWCMTFSTDKAVVDLLVTLRFYAVYNPNTNLDDQLHEPNILVDVEEVDYSELRHVTPGGQLASAQDSNENVIGSRHYACIIPSAEGDLLDPADINFTGNGPSVTDLQIFNDGVSAGAPNFPGVVDGTICIGWISSAPGEQFLDLKFTKVIGVVTPEERFVSWDSNNDANDDDDEENDGPENGALIIQWNVIDKTEISTSNDPDDEDDFITFTRQERTLQFNVGDGTFFAGEFDLVELVFGSHTGATGKIEALLDGVSLVATITSKCGYFVVEDGVNDLAADLARKSITGVSVQGRFDLDPDGFGNPADGLYDGLTITITNDPNCNQNSVLRLEIQAIYPGPIGSSNNVVFGTEWVEWEFSFVPAQKVPRVAWAGTTVDTIFALGGNCNAFLGQTVYFIRPEGQAGTFLPNDQVSVDGAGNATGELDPQTCSITAPYHSEIQGEVDIEISFSDNPFARVAHPIYYLAFEDVTMNGPSELSVSERGDLTADVRGWFTGTNPSGNEARTTEDGRALPQDRWVLPDDWDRLRGDSTFRPNWPSTAPMPLLNVTFFMENEGIVNSYQAGISDGAVGWFLLDGTESSLNVNPFTKEPSRLGSVARPRIITDLTDGNGEADVDIFGDFNLSYVGCDLNEPTGNPHCGIDDLAGVTRYYAVAEYPGDRGKYPVATSNVLETQFFWRGYKDVTVEDTGLPFQKFVVAHLKDRDGFCDALSFNNTLGVPVNFVIDSDNGVILEAQDQPAPIVLDNKEATPTTYDTLDNNGNPINVELVKTVLFDDECQAWIRVSSSLLKPVNVLVRFDAPPSEVPAEVRITSLSCTNETVTVTNLDDHLVSLAGFGLRSRTNDFIMPEEHLDLIGHLAPGESKTFHGGTDNGWIGGGNRTFDDAPDYARLVWNEFEISRIACDGTDFQPAIPSPLPKDGEGEIWIDTVVEFGSPSSVPLSLGWNLVTFSGEPRNVGEAFDGYENHVEAVYSWNPDTGVWDRHFISGPAYINSFQQFQEGVVYWVEVNQAFTMHFGE